MSGNDSPLVGMFRPAPEDIQELIAAAHEHSMGIDFLLDGDLGSVAAMFRVHAFTVEAAREYWLQHRGEKHGVSKTDPSL